MDAMQHPDNWRSEVGANDLAYRIRAYWEKRGYNVQTHVVHDHGAWGVRSDMIAGLPLGYKHGENGL